GGTLGGALRGPVAAAPAPLRRGRAAARRRRQQRAQAAALSGAHALPGRVQQHARLLPAEYLSLDGAGTAVRPDRRRGRDGALAVLAGARRAGLGRARRGRLLRPARVGRTAVRARLVAPAAPPRRRRRGGVMARVTLYTRDGCPHCARQRE